MKGGVQCYRVHIRGSFLARRLRPAPEEATLALGEEQRLWANRQRSLGARGLGT